MKKRAAVIVSIFSLIIVILLGSKMYFFPEGNERDNSLLKEGQVWRGESAGRYYQIKIKNETTWEYSDFFNPEPVDVIVERKDNYYGNEAYRIIKSNDAKKFVNKKEGVFIIPFFGDNVKKISIQKPKSEDWTEEEILKNIENAVPNYTLQ